MKEEKKVIVVGCGMNVSELPLMIHKPDIFEIKELKHIAFDVPLREQKYESQTWKPKWKRR